MSIPNCSQIESDDSDYMRLVLIGKTGNGKSASANSLIGQKNYFKSGSSQSSLTQRCQAVTFDFKQKKILLVDTPGLADLMRNENSLLNEYKKAFEIAKPGPHVFLIVLSVASRFTKENIEVIDFIQNYFGKQIFDHSIILFTGIDNIESDNIDRKINISDFIIDLRNNFPFLDQLLNNCNNNYLKLSNRWEIDDNNMNNFRSECFDLINKIIREKRDGNEYYTNDQFRISVDLFEREKRKEHEKIDEQIINLSIENDRLTRNNKQLIYMLKNNIDDSKVLKIRY